jgi:predicted DNA-binding protein (MmcQ/YjbR family)
VDTQELAARVAELALSFPQAYEDRPFGDFPVYKVPPNKLFALAPLDGGAVVVTLKVTPEEREVALGLPFVSVARYVGRYGWITSRVTDEESLAATLEWLRESYWLKAPKKLREAAWRP